MPAVLALRVAIRIELLCKPKVCDDAVVVFRQKHVARSQITMDDGMLVQVTHVHGNAFTDVSQLLVCAHPTLAFRIGLDVNSPI